jgi:hypothetical protein
VTAADPYRPDPFTAEERAANEQAAEEATAPVAAPYLAETAGRHLNRRLRDMQDQAARLARGLTRYDRKRGRA